MPERKRFFSIEVFPYIYAKSPQSRLLLRIVATRPPYLPLDRSLTPVSLISLSFLCYYHLCYCQRLILCAVQKAVQVKPEVETLKCSRKSIHSRRTDLCEDLDGNSHFNKKCISYVLEASPRWHLSSHKETRQNPFDCGRSRSKGPHFLSCA